MTLRYYQIPFILLSLVAAGFGLSLLFQDQNPVLQNISPRVGNPGEVMVIDGSYFGSDATASWVSIAGERITSSNILEWTPQRISLRIPDQARSGAVVVGTPSGVSKEQTFTNQNQIPQVEQSGNGTADAYISELSPETASPGDPLTIRGRNFGSSQGGVEVLVDGISLPASEIYSWGSREIGFWLPMFARDGKVQLRQKSALSNSKVVIVLRDTGGLEAVGTISKFRISLMYELRDLEFDKRMNWGSITAFVPIPPQGLAQVVSDQHFDGAFPASFVPPGMLAFTVSRFDNDQTYRVGADWTVQTQQLRLTVDKDPETGYDNFKELRDRYTAPSTLVPLPDQALKNFASKAVGAETKPLARARLLYHAVVDVLRYDQDAGLSYASQVLADTKANAFGYADLFVGVCRAVGIPARLIEGIFVDKQNTALSHFWAECFIPGIGWIPVDPALGDGLYSNELGFGASASAFYFGNLDERHVALISGEGMTSLTRIDANIQKLFQRFVLMQVHAESAGSVESFGLFIDTPGVRRLQ